MEKARVYREGIQPRLWQTQCGKIQLLNSLLKEDRAIVTAIPERPGFIEEEVNVEGILLS